VKIETGKTYLTRDGERVRVLCTDRPDDVYPVIGMAESGWVTSYTESGRYLRDAADSLHDLVGEAPERVTMYVYRDDYDGGLYAYEYDDGGSLKTIEVEL
jgi:hypothetical protein